MVFYYLIFAFIFCIVIFNQISKKITNLSSFINIAVISFIVAVRDGVGTDFENYVLIYNLAPTIYNFFNNTIQIDILFWLLCSLIKTFEGNEAILFFIIAFITNLVFLKTLKKITPNFIFIGFLIYFSFFLLRFQFNTIRHGIMASFVWYAFTFIEERNLKKYLLFITIAGGFHFLGFLFLPCYWILNISLKRVSYLIILALSFLGIFANPFNFISYLLPKGGFMFEKFNYYTQIYYGDDDSELGITLGMIVYTFFFIYILYKKNFFIKIKHGKMLLNSLFFALFFAFFFNKYGVFVERITSVFYISLVFLIPIFLYRYPIKKSSKIILNIFFVFYLLLLLNKNLKAKEYDDHYQYLPYKTIF